MSIHPRKLAKFILHAFQVTQGKMKRQIMLENTRFYVGACFSLAFIASVYVIDVRMPILVT